MSDGIEKLQKYAFGMNPRRCDDILLLADQIKREHVSELQAIEAEIDKRLMPPGMEWPRFDDGERVEFGSAVDGLGGPCEKFIFTRSMGGVCQLQDAGGRMVNVLHGGRVKRQKPEVLGADGVPLKVGETVWYVGEHLVSGTVEAVGDGDGEVMLAGDGVYAPSDLTHTPPDTQEAIGAQGCRKYRIKMEGGE